MHHHHLDKRTASLIAAGAGNPDDLLPTRDVATWLGVSKQWLEIGRHRGFGPPYLKLGRMVRYRREHVSDWLKERMHVPTRGVS
jgi:predicted DNA-binding transcriptional regulator AlpA